MLVVLEVFRVRKVGRQRPFLSALLVVEEVEQVEGTAEMVLQAAAQVKAALPVRGARAIMEVTTTPTLAAEAEGQAQLGATQRARLVETVGQERQIVLQEPL